MKVWNLRIDAKLTPDDAEICARKCNKKIYSQGIYKMPCVFYEIINIR